MTAGALARESRNCFRSRPSIRAGFQGQQHVAVDFFDMVNLDAFGGFTSFARFQIELMGVQRTDNPVAAEQPFGKRALAVRATVLGGEDPSVALPEHGHFPGSDNVAAALTGRNRVDGTQIDGWRYVSVSHCSLLPPMC